MDKHYTQLSETELQQLVTLLDLSDNDLWDMITTRKELEDVSLRPVLRLLQAA
ncbi:MAG: succinate dehydrogenase assembly factor 2 [Pseudomonadota bacterium]